jgi:hypothetical protein
VVSPKDGKEETIWFIYLGFFEKEVILVLITCSNHNSSIFFLAIGLTVKLYSGIPRLACLGRT